jgi:tetratricopeptide (TPR) repeat protein
VARREGQDLRAHYPTDFAASPEQLFAWHEREAENAEQAGEWSAALPHLDRLIASRPVSAGLRARRGTAHAELGHWEQAAADFGHARFREPDDTRFWYLQAVAQLAGRGDTAGYRQSCTPALDRFGQSNDPAVADSVVRMCLIAADTVTDPAALVSLVERAAASNPRSPAYLTTLGGALYRAGRLEAAVQRLTEASAPGTGGGEAAGWLFLAMAQTRLGHAVEAREWLGNAEGWLEQALQRRPGANPLAWDQRLILQKLRREAEAVIGLRSR